jgi:hypothetical protein
MQSPQNMRNPVQRMLAAALAWTLVLGSPALPVQAATTPLADVPIAAKVAAKPNIVFTLDDSGSMQFSYTPDFVPGNYCRSGNNITACSVGGLNSFSTPPFYAADFNRLAYDPNVVYLPPVKANGQPLTYSIGTYTDANGNQAYFAKVQSDPFINPATSVDLTAKVTVPVYCNTDWPLITNANGPVLATDVGNANGEYAALSGAWCRINGTAYDLSASSGAPAVAEGYNYPYLKSAGADGPQYFYRNLGGKSLWCDKTSPNWPRVTSGGTCTWSCTVGTVVNTPQTCNAGGPTNTCCTGVGSPAGCTTISTYTPGGCKGNALYCGPYGTGSAPECLACACNGQPNGRNGSCSITGAGCGCTGNGCAVVVNGNPACPDQPTGCTMGGTLVKTCTGAAGSAACNSMRADAAMTLLADANGPGTVCRHNNQSYAVGGAAGLFKYPGNYPGEGTGTGNFNTQTTSGCPTVGNVTIPRHYYQISSVLFCNAVDGTANGPWKGFGVGPSCQTKNDLSTYRNVKYGAFKRANLINDGRLFPYIDQITGASLTRTYAQEIINYANWYAYYRLRSLAAKTTSALAFSYLDDTYRVGFHTLGTEPVPSGTGVSPAWVDVADFSVVAGGSRNAWYTALFAVPTVTNYKTPSLSGALRIGHLFETGLATGLPATVMPLPGTPTDPITLSCQNNYHILFTDGFTNQVNWPAVPAVGEQDNTVPVWGASIIDVPPENVMPNLRPRSGAPWPTPFLQDMSKPMGDTLADIAMSYWSRDLRALKNDVPAEPGKGVDDLDYTKDIAWWQHVSFNALSFGAEGLLDAANPAATMAAIKAGTAVWTKTINQSTGAPQANSPTNPPGNPGASAIDDLWHATVNARGKFVYAKSPLEVSYGLASILAGIQNQRKSRVGAAFSGQVLDSTNNTIYETTIERGWAGDLLKVTINPATGAETATVWKANTRLGLQIKPAVDGDEPWFTKRKVVTLNDSTGVGVPFLYTNLSTNQLNSLSPAATQQQKMIAYLRGGTTFGPTPTTAIEGTSIGQFRKRFGALGDISNAQAVIVDAPARPYLDANDPKYSVFVAAQAARPTRVFAPANDGMVHSFDGATGDEVFAFIPSALFRGVAGNVATQDVTGIQALTYQDGGVPIYHHHFYVDSSPKVADVDFTNGGGDWHTILVGGLGKGGNCLHVRPTGYRQDASLWMVGNRHVGLQQ